jgi:hypothetical protein
VLAILETDLAYMAGFVEADGHISIIETNRKAYNTCYSVQLGITNTNPEILEWFAELFEGGRINMKTKVKGRKQGRDIRWNKVGQVKEILTLLLPYLKIKKVQALLVIEFADVIQSHEERTGYKGFGPKRYSGEETDLLMELHFGVSSLNRRGE